VYQDAAHAGGARHAAGVLAGGATEAEQREIARIQALAGGHLPDGIGHRLDAHFKK
jgi:hypothetical protein